ELAVNALPEGLDQHGSERQRPDCAERDLWAYVDHERQRGCGEDEAVSRVHDRRAEKLANGAEVVGRARHDVAGAMRMVETGGLAFEVGEEIVAKIEFDLTGRSDDDLARDVEEDGGECGDHQQAKRVVDDLGFGDAVFHVIDGVADDERKNYADDVVGYDRHPTPGEILPISPEVRVERSDAFEHAVGVSVSEMLSLDGACGVWTRHCGGFADGVSDGAALVSG